MYKKNNFNYKTFKNKQLITNSIGEYAFITSRELDGLKNNTINSEKLKNELLAKCFIYDEDKGETFFYDYKNNEKKELVNYGTTLHIFVVSKNCNFNCVYCQAGHLNQNEPMLMSKKTAQKAVDIAMQTPAKDLIFEFQGGEPLTNFKVIKFIVKYSQEKNNLLKDKKKIEYNLVSNLTLLTDDMAKFLVSNNVTICTSIDGNEELQNINRPYAGHNSYEETTNKIRKLQYSGIRVGAIQTTTRYSLYQSKEIIDEYIKLGFDNIFIRPLTKLGKATSNWNKIGYTPEEFLKFYKKSLDYIIKLNKRGFFISENYACLLLDRIINKEVIKYMELRSPCGACIGQIAYYYDGNIYTCDEGRMLGEMGDKRFLVGNVNESTYQSLICSECAKEAKEASTLEKNEICSKCVYSPYCGTCPVTNYSESGSMNMTSKDNFKCKILTGVLDILFTYIKEDKAALKIFKSWI